MLRWPLAFLILSTPSMSLATISVIPLGGFCSLHSIELDKYGHPRRSDYPEQKFNLGDVEDFSRRIMLSDGTFHSFEEYLESASYDRDLEPQDRFVVISHTGDRIEGVAFLVAGDAGLTARKFPEVKNFFKPGMAVDEIVHLATDRTRGQRVRIMHDLLEGIVLELDALHKKDHERLLIGRANDDIHKAFYDGYFSETYQLSGESNWLGVATLSHFRDLLINNVKRADTVLGQTIDFDEAIKQVEFAINQLPENSRRYFTTAHRKKVDLLMQAGRFDTAEKQLKRIYGTDSDNRYLEYLTIMTLIGRQFNFFTGEGDLNSAMEIVRLFKNDKHYEWFNYNPEVAPLSDLPASYSDARYVEFMMQIETEQWERIEYYLHHKLRRHLHILRKEEREDPYFPEYYEHIKDYYDLAKGIGNPSQLLSIIHSAQLQGRAGVSKIAYELKHQAYKALGDEARAAKYDRIARRMPDVHAININEDMPKNDPDYNGHPKPIHGIFEPTKYTK